jgi:hypothetical protein
LKPRSDDVGELSAEGRCTESQYDEIWEKVQARVEMAPAVRPRRRGLRFLALGGAFTGAVAGWLLFASPRVGHFTARGGASTRSAAFQISCSSSGRALCRPGETLMFSVNSALARGFLGAYAERLDAPAGGRIWYLPGSGSAGPVVEAGEVTIVLRQGIQIGPEQPAGRYRVTVWTSPRPISRPVGGRVDGASSYAELDLEVAP